MASNRKRTKAKRRMRKTNAGASRKKKLENHGTTRTEAELFGNVLQ